MLGFASGPTQAHNEVLRSCNRTFARRHIRLGQLRSDSISLTPKGLLSATASLPRTLAGTASSRVISCRLVIQQLVRPALQDTPVQVCRELPTPGIDHQPQVQAPMPLPHPQRLAEHRNCPGHTHPPEERHPPRRQWQPTRRHHKGRRQLLQSQAAAVLRRRLAVKPRVDVLRVDRLLQSARNFQRRSPAWRSAGRTVAAGTGCWSSPPRR